MKKAKKILSIILSVITLLSILPVTVNAAEVTGTCGENVTWAYDDSTSTLTISGEGAMNNYNTGSKPWEKYKTHIKKVVIENGVTSIGDYAFCNYDGLSEVIIPESMVSIGKQAFDLCAALERILIPNSVKILGVMFVDESVVIDYCGTSTEWISIKEENGQYLCCYFVNCQDGKIYPSGKCGDNLTWVIDDSKTLTIMGEGDMYDYEIEEDWWGDFYAITPWCDYDINTVVIGMGVTKIGNSAFAGCYKLKNVTIPESVIIIAENAFRSCYNLADVLIPNSVTTIGDYAFCGCDDMLSITIPDSVTTIGHSAFRGCSNLADVLIPNSVTTIGDGAFAYCGNLTSITIPDSVTIIGYQAFIHCSNLMNIIIPDSVTTIGKNAFRDCDALKTVTIGDGTKSIGEYAFYDCGNLTTVTIGDSTEIIGDYAFRECDKLSTVYLRDNITSCISDSLTISNRLKIYYSGTEEQWDAIYVELVYVPSPEVYCNYHIHKPDYETVEPTCTTHGYEKHFCRYYTDSTCDYIATTTYTANPTGHTFNADGICEACGEKEVSKNPINTQTLTIESVLAMVMNLLAKIFGVFSVA